MSNSHRMRWRPAVGVLVLGGIAIGLTWVGASANKARNNSRTLVQTPGAAQIATPTRATPITEKPSSEMVAENAPTKVTKSAAGINPAVVTNAASVSAAPTGLAWISPDDGWDPAAATASLAGKSFRRANAVSSVVAAGPLGACCTTVPLGCTNNIDTDACNALSGVHHPGESCLNDPCNLASAACCNSAGVCTGDTNRPTCEGGGGTWNADASCAGSKCSGSPFSPCPNGISDCPSGACTISATPCHANVDCATGQGTCAGAQTCTGKPPPSCNQYLTNNCSWDNAGFLNDGGNIRSHIHSSGDGQLPRYDFNAADDFILRGDSTQCELSAVRAIHRERAASAAQIPDPNIDWEAAVVTVQRDRLDPTTNYNGPGGFAEVPIDGTDLSNKHEFSDTPGGIVYSRAFLNDASAITFTDLSAGTCDPPAGNENAAVWQIDITLNPPMLLNKNVPYWFSLQGVFPFNDGGNTLQTWAALSTRNTGRRAVTFRTDNPAYYVGGNPVLGAPQWLPLNFNNVGTTATPPQGGNLGNYAPGVPTPPPILPSTPRCAGFSVNTRFDMSFRLFGHKASPAETLAADLCTALIPIFDGNTGINSTGAATNGPAATCGTPTADLWYQYTSTCSGKLTVSTSGTTFDSIAVIYDSVGFSCAAPAGELACGNNETLDDAIATTPVDITGIYYIRVGGISGASGKGVITVECDKACGNPGASECCDADIECKVNADCPDGSLCGGPNPPTSSLHCSTDNLPCLVDGDCAVLNPVQTCVNTCDYVLFGCKNEECCNAVCFGDPACCGQFGGSWDDQCAAAAHNEVVCSCPCAFTPLGGAVAEAEGAIEGIACATATPCNGGACVAGFCDCKARMNSGCNTGVTFADPEPFDAISCGAVIKAKAWADAASRDVDWYRFSVPDGNTDGEAELVIQVRSSIPIGISVIKSNTDLDPNVHFCFNSKKCSVTSATICNVTADCPSGETCEDDPATSTQYDEISTGACLDRTMTVCVPAPGVYSLVASAADTNIVDGEEEVGDGIFEGYGCGTSNDYSFSLVCNASCQPGACCTCLGSCVDGITEASCVDQLGTYKGEGSTCAGVGSCAADADPCATATQILCGQSIQVDLTTQVDPSRLPPSCGNAGNIAHDPKWFFFTATGVSARVSTCNTASNPGGDSILAVYEGTCCGTGANEFSEVGCSDDICGYNLFMGDICMDNLTPSQVYYIQVTNWDDTVHGLYTLTLNCPCSGSCCNGATGSCADGIATEACTGVDDSFDSLNTCAQLSPPCGIGACCNNVTGTCVDTIPSGCTTGDDSHNHHPGASCATMLCNLGGTCSYDNGQFDNANGFTSMLRTDQLGGRIIEVADDFNLYRLPTSGDNNCLVDSIYYETFHTGHNAPCTIGGGGGCADSAADYGNFPEANGTAIVACISPDLDGDAKGPTCVPSTPVSAGADGDYHEPLAVTGAACICTVFGPAPQDPPVSGNYFEFNQIVVGGQAENDITLHFDPPMELDKNKKYWLSIMNVWRVNSGYSIIWGRSAVSDGNYLQQFDSAGAQEWTPQPDGDGLTENLGFVLNGVKNLGCGSCQLYADIEPGFCLIDVDDLVCLLAGFANFGDCPQADIQPCDLPSGIIDVDDLIALLGGFAGDPPPSPCEHPCAPGGCILPSTECRDEFYIPGGMSQTDCSALGGSYCGDGTICGVDCP